MIQECWNETVIIDAEGDELLAGLLQKYGEFGYALRPQNVAGNSKASYAAKDGLFSAYNLNLGWD